MQMKTGTLLKQLGDEHAKLYGAVNAEVYGVCLLCSEEQSSDGILYITDGADKLPHAGARSTLVVPHGEAEQTAARLCSILARDYQANELLNRLSEAVKARRPAEEAARICSGIMKGQIYFLSHKFSFIAASHGAEAKVKLMSVLTEYRDDKDVQWFSAQLRKNAFGETILSPIYSNEKLKGYVLAVSSEHTFDETAIHCAAAMNNALAESSIFNHDGMISTQKHKFVHSCLAYGTDGDEEGVLAKMREFGFRSDKYYLLSLKASGGSILRAELQSMLGGEIYEYNDYYFTITGIEIKERLSEATYPAVFTDFLKSNNLFAGVSNGFLDFTSLGVAFQQSIAAVTLRRYISGDGFRLSRYEDLILSHLLQQAHQNSGYSYKSFCHPNTRYVERYDQEHGTEYLKTIVAYVFNNARLSETAQKLHIHKNTLYHRLTFLKEQFGFDFDTPREFMKLQIACTVYGFIGDVYSMDLFGPINK